MNDENKTKTQLIEKIKNLAKFPSENPNPVLRVTKTGKILYANEASLPLLAKWGSGTDELMPDRWLRLIADAFDTSQNLVEEYGFNGRVFSFVITPVKGTDYVNIYVRDISDSKKKEEELRECRCHLEELVNERTAQLTASNEQLHDEINQRKIIEEELRENTEFSFNLLQNSPNPIIVINPDKSIKFVNHTLENLTGFSFAELIGKKPPYPYWTKETVEKTNRGFTKSFGGKGAVRVEEYFKKKNGERFWVEVTAMPVENNGKLKYYVANFVDITERKQAEKTLLESETKFRTVFEHAGGAIFIADTETGKVLDCNKLAEKLIGRALEEIIGMYQSELHPENEAEKYKAKFASHILKGHVLDFEGEVQHKDGRRIPVYIIAQVMEIEGKKIIVGFFFDVTERKKMEEELQKMEKLETIGVLAGGIAHDFNNLLTGILGNLSLAELFVKPGDKVYDALTRAKKTSQHAGQLTQQLLTFSKGGAPIKETASMSELIENMASFALRGSNVRYESSLPDTLWSVEIDKGQISQVINNLIINADHAMSTGGIIKISAKNTTINVNDSLPLKDGRYIKVAVKDQGIGISEEHLSKIFDPYFTTKENGSGLGLASCYSIVKNHRGYITVESEVGAGTMFHIYLPASDKEFFVVKDIVEEIYLGKGKVLFMDDEEDVINTARQMLKQIGYEVKIAKTGMEAIEFYRKANETGECFDAVILDLTIPGDMGGKEAIKKLLEIDPEVKAIVSSGYSNNPIMAEYKQYGLGM